MDNVSYRNSRPNQPRDISQPKPQQPTESASPRAKFSGGPAKRRPLKLIALVAGILLLALAGWFAYGRLSGSASVIDSSKYQAVFFTNGQVYFGKLSPVNGDYMRLKNVYYLQNKSESTNETSPQSASAQTASDVELIKLGNEIHGPEDEMLISKDQVLFFENLKPAGTVSQTITNFQKTKQ